MPHIGELPTLPPIGGRSTRIYPDIAETVLIDIGKPVTDAGLGAVPDARRVHPHDGHGLPLFPYRIALSQFQIADRIVVIAEMPSHILVQKRVERFVRTVKLHQAVVILLCIGVTVVQIDARVGRIDVAPRRIGRATVRHAANEANRQRHAGKLAQQFFHLYALLYRFLAFLRPNSAIAAAAKSVTDVAAAAGFPTFTMDLQPPLSSVPPLPLFLAASSSSV